MGVRFDRLTPESQTTLDTILEEKIRLQQSGVAPGSIARRAGIAVRRVSGAFATIDAQAREAAAAAGRGQTAPDGRAAGGGRAGRRRCPPRLRGPGRWSGAGSAASLPARAPRAASHRSVVPPRCSRRPPRTTSTRRCPRWKKKAADRPRCLSPDGRSTGPNRGRAAPTTRPRVRQLVVAGVLRERSDPGRRRWCRRAAPGLDR